MQIFFTPPPVPSEHQSTKRNTVQTLNVRWTRRSLRTRTRGTSVKSCIAPPGAGASRESLMVQERGPMIERYCLTSCNAICTIMIADTSHKLLNARIYQSKCCTLKIGTPPPCVSYANVRNYYGPYAHCSLDKAVACAQHILLLAHTCACAWYDAQVQKEKIAW